MTLTEYQEQANLTAVYPRDNHIHTVYYNALALAGEAGEVAGKVSKIIRDEARSLTSARREQLRDELGDVLWHAAMLAFELGYTLDEIGVANLNKLRTRAMAERLHGEGDSR